MQNEEKTILTLESDRYHLVLYFNSDALLIEASQFSKDRLPGHAINVKILANSQDDLFVVANAPISDFDKEDDKNFAMTFTWKPEARKNQGDKKSSVKQEIVQVNADVRTFSCDQSVARDVISFVWKTQDLERVLTDG